jgi:hypothetical protein
MDVLKEARAARAGAGRVFTRLQAEIAETRERLAELERAEGELRSLGNGHGGKAPRPYKSAFTQEALQRAFAPRAS